MTLPPYRPGDLVRVSVPTGTADHNGDLRTWSVRTVFRVLLSSPDGTVTVSEDSRGLRTTIQADRLVMHRRAEHTTQHGA